MRNLHLIILISFSFCMFTSCSKCECTGEKPEFTLEELEWMTPADLYDSVMFSSNENTIEFITFHVSKYEFTEVPKCPSMSFSKCCICPESEIKYTYLEFANNKGYRLGFRVELHKVLKPTPETSMFFSVNGRIFNYHDDVLDSLSVASGTYYNVFVIHDNSFNPSFTSVYFTKKHGLIKFTDNKDVEWEKN